jgi:hypothetical protein
VPPVPADGGGAPPNRRRRRWTLVAVLGVLALVGAASLWFVLAPEASQCRIGQASCVQRFADAAAGNSAGVSPAPSAAASAHASAIPSASVKPSASATKPGGKRSTGPVSGGCVGVACSYPNAGNTGPAKGSMTSKSGDTTITKNGSVLDHWDLKGSLDIYADNVTVQNCRIASKNWWGINLRPGHTGLRVLHCVITGVPGAGQDNGGEDYAVSNMSNGTIEVGWNNVSQFGNALSMGHGNIHDNYVHDLSAFINLGGEYQHTDALISDGGDKGGMMIKHNTLLNQIPVNKGASAAVGLFADTGIVSNTTVDGNWIAGGAYALYGGNTGATNIKVTNNVFSTQFWPSVGYYGPVTAWNAKGAGNVWSNNVTSEGRPVKP